jgi:hypothetical protein
VRVCAVLIMVRGGGRCVSRPAALYPAPSCVSASRRSRSTDKDAAVRLPSRSAWRCCLLLQVRECVVLGLWLRAALAHPSATPKLAPHSGGWGAAAVSFRPAVATAACEDAWAAGATAPQLEGVFRVGRRDPPCAVPLGPLCCLLLLAAACCCLPQALRWRVTTAPSGPLRRAHMKALVINDVLGVTAAKSGVAQPVPVPVLRALLASPVTLVQVRRCVAA